MVAALALGCPAVSLSLSLRMIRRDETKPAVVQFFVAGDEYRGRLSVRLSVRSVCANRDRNRDRDRGRMAGPVVFGIRASSASCWRLPRAVDSTNFRASEGCLSNKIESEITQSQSSFFFFFLIIITYLFFIVNNCLKLIFLLISLTIKVLESF